MASIEIGRAAPRWIAAVRRSVRLGEVGAAWRPALDLVWTFLRAHPDLRDGGHNVFVYHHPPARGAPMEVDFGVEVTRAFEPEGDVRCVETPSGEVITVVHVGPYERLRETHDAIHAWCAANGRRIGPASWEEYGDWIDDPAKLETRVSYLLVARGD